MKFLPVSFSGPQASNPGLYEYGWRSDTNADRKGMGLPNYGIRIYNNPRTYWHNLKNRAYRKQSLLPTDLNDWKKLEQKTGRQLMVLNSSETIDYPLDFLQIENAICERLRQTKNGLDIFAKINIDLLALQNNFSSIKDKSQREEFYKTNIKNYEKENNLTLDPQEQESFKLFLMVTDAIKNGCNVPVEMYYRNHQRDRPFFWANLKQEKKIIQWWTGGFFVEDNNEYRALAFYPYSSLASGDDTLSQSFSFSYDFPMMPLQISSHGNHLRHFFNLMQQNLNGNQVEQLENFPKLPLLYSWFISFKSHNRPVATVENFPQLLKEWRQLQSWVRKYKNIENNLDKFFREQMGEEFYNFLPKQIIPKKSVEIKKIEKEIKRLEGQLQEFKGKLKTSDRHKKNQILKKINELKKRIN